MKQEGSCFGKCPQLQSQDSLYGHVWCVRVCVSEVVGPLLGWPTDRLADKGANRTPPILRLEGKTEKEKGRERERAREIKKGKDKGLKRRTPVWKR